MGFGNILVIVLILVYLKYFYNLFDKRKRKVVLSSNKRLEELRKIVFKTLEEQREFVELRYPKRLFAWSWKNVGVVILSLLVGVCLFLLFSKGFKFLNIDLSLWQGLGIIFIVPLIINFLLSRFGVEKQNSLVNILSLGNKKKRVKK